MRKAIRDFLVWALCVALAIVALSKCQGNIDLTDNGNGHTAVIAPTPQPTVAVPKIGEMFRGLLK